MVDPAQLIEQAIGWVCAFGVLAGLVTLVYSGVTARKSPERSKRLANMVIVSTATAAGMVLFGSYLGLIH